MIIVQQWAIDFADDVWIDNTEVDLSDVLINGKYKAQLAQYSDGMIQLIWENSYVFHLTSYDCPLELVLQIAESIR